MSTAHATTRSLVSSDAIVEPFYSKLGSKRGLADNTSSITSAAWYRRFICVVNTVCRILGRRPIRADPWTELLTDVADVIRRSNRLHK